MKKSSQTKTAEEFDDVDGALFSRIPSKQCELGNTSSQSTGKDNTDGALFSRIPSQKNSSTKGKQTTGSKSKKTGNESKKSNDSVESLECTIKPEDLSDESNSETGSKCNDPLIGKNKKDKGKVRNMDTGSSSSSLAGSDHSDAIQGSRRNLQELDDNPEPEIVAHSSSTFYTQPPCSDVISQDVVPDQNTSQGSDVSFYVEGTEHNSQDTLESNDTQVGLKNESDNDNSAEQIELSIIENGNENPHPSNEESPLSARDDFDSPQSTHAMMSCSRSNCWPVTKALIFPILSLGVYFWDIGSDIYLAINYKENGDNDLFCITLACIVIPHILMAMVDVSWVWLDRRRANKCRLILGCLTLGRIVRSFNYMYHIYKAKLIPKEKESEVLTQGGQSRSWLKGRAREEKRDCFYLDFINAFMESAPQLFVQLYLYYAFNLELTVLRVMNLLSSWVSIAWTYAAYYRSNREVLAGKQDVKKAGFAFFICSVLASLAARFICTALFLVNSYTWIGGLCIFVHFFVMFLWICFKERPALEGAIACSSGRFLYYIFFAYVSVLCFMNLSDGRARIRMTLFYVVIYIENCVMAILSYLPMTEDENGSGKETHLLVLPVGFVLHVVLLIIYYRCLHPKTKQQCKIPCTDSS